MGGPSVRDQLLAAHQKSSSFAGLVADYLQCQHRIRELEVRNAQLDREAGELRLENDSLLRSVEDARHSSASAAELEEALSRAAALQAELLEAYKEKGAASEGQATALQQLEVVRNLNAQQAAGLDHAREEQQRLLVEIRSLRADVSRLAAARDLSTKELEARTTEVEEMSLKIAGLEDENRDFVDRLLAMKDAEMVRMNETAKLCEDMVVDARRQAASVIAAARASAAREAGASVGEESARRLNAAAEAVGGAALPTVALRCARNVHSGGCWGMTFNAQGSALATCGADRTVRLWDVARGVVTSELRGSSEGVNGVAFTLDGKAVLGAEDKAVRLWDCRSGRLVKALTGHIGKVNGVITSPADADIAITCAASPDRSIKIWKLGRAECVRTFRVPSNPRRVAVMVDSGLVVSAHVDGKLRFWDQRSQRSDPAREVEIHAGKEIFSVVAALAGGKVVTCGRDSVLSVVDTRTFAVTHRLSADSFRVEHSPWATPAFSPSGHHVVGGSEDGSVNLWSLEAAGGDNSAQKCLRQPKTAPKEQQSAAVVACAWSPAGLPLVTSDRLGGVTFWGTPEINSEK